MKKFVLFFLLLISAMAVTVSFAANNGSHDIHNPVIILELPEKELINDFILPKSVVVIEEEAFEGTAIVRVELPETLTTIGDRSFANIRTLRTIRIPTATKIIASTAFDGSENVSIHAAPNSYARKYAKAQGLPFAPEAMLCAASQVTVNVGVSSNHQIAIDTVSFDDTEPEKQWRRINEVNIVSTIDIFLNEIQSRGPPIMEVKC